MTPFQIIAHNGRQIVIVDLSKTDPEQQLAALPEAQKRIASLPQKSVLLLTDVTNARYNTASAAAMKEWASKNTPFLKASAVVGAAGMLSIVLGTIRLITGRDIKSFDTRLEAMDWLITVN